MIMAASLIEREMVVVVNYRLKGVADRVELYHCRKIYPVQVGHGQGRRSSVVVSLPQPWTWDKAARAANAQVRTYIPLALLLHQAHSVTLCENLVEAVII